MSDATMTVAVLRERAVTFRDERDWRQFHTPKDLALAVAVEAAELAELFLWKTPEEVSQALDGSAFRTRVADEIADVLLYLLSMSAATGIDVSDATEAKIIKNAAKYPVERSRGSARKYTDPG